MARPTYGPDFGAPQLAGFDGGSQVASPVVLVPSPGAPHTVHPGARCGAAMRMGSLPSRGRSCPVGLHREHHLGCPARDRSRRATLLGVHHVAVDLKMGDVVLPPGRVPAAARSGAAPESRVWPRRCTPRCCAAPERSFSSSPGLDGETAGCGIAGINSSVCS